MIMRSMLFFKGKMFVHHNDDNKVRYSIIMCASMHVSFRNPN